MADNPASQQEFENYVESLVAAQVAKNEAARAAGSGVAPVPPAQAEPAPIKVNVGGKEWAFKTQDELSAALNQTFATYNERLAAAEAHKPQPNGGGYVQGNDRPNFDLNHYIKTIAEDPLKAADYIDEARFGVKDPVSVIKQGIAMTNQLASIVAAYQFRDQNPEFPANPQAAQVLDEVRQKYNLPFNPNGLKAAYALAKNEGLLNQFQNQNQQNQQEQGDFAPPKPRQRTPYTGSQGGWPDPDQDYAPPSVGRGKGPGIGPEFDPEELSEAQIVEIFNKVGSRG